MQKYVIILSAIVLLIGMAVVYLLPMLMRFPMHPRSVYVAAVEVNDRAITMHLSLSGSSDFYANYKTDYRDGALYVTIIATYFKRYGKHDPALDADYRYIVNIPNTYGPIKSIYLSGSLPEEDQLIWADGVYYDRAEKARLEREAEERAVGVGNEED
jgi:hypothetical protein